MSDVAPREPGFESVSYSTSDDGLPFAYRRGQVITTELRRALAILERLDETGRDEGLAYQKVDAWPDEESDNLDRDRPTMGPETPVEPAPSRWYDPGEEPPDPDRPTADPESDGPFFLVRGVRDPLRAVIELQSHGIVAQLNYVYFAHPGGASPWLGAAGQFNASPVYASPVYASPVYASPVYASPVYASPVYASPVNASPVYASPVNGSPVYASPVVGTDAVPQTSSAVPAEEGHTTEAVWARLHEPVRHGARVFVLDTGLADHHFVSPELGALLDAPHAVRPLRPSDATDRPQGHHHFLAPAAGHGTFIAGLISQVAPGCAVAVGKVLDHFGVGDEWTIARRIHALTRGLALRDDEARHSILSLSFGAPVLEHPHLLAHVVSGIQALGVVVVASAGNDAMSRPVFPAALPGVVGVGAFGPTGPAAFSNFGPWVNACAPGVDLVGIFFSWSDRPEHLQFRGWAIWSGTSFAGPIVAGAVARLIMTAPVVFNHPMTAAEARRRLLEPPWLLRIPNLGTVVNLL
jgi:subtilisin family serine protease